MSLGGQQMRIGPMDNVQFLFILLDRAFIYYSHVINWAHGRREKPLPPSRDISKAGIAARWNEVQKQICMKFFRAIRGNDDARSEKARRRMKALILETLTDISHSENLYGEHSIPHDFGKTHR
jgi:hypothetical protein